jgi:hypothetical protein
MTSNFYQHQKQEKECNDALKILRERDTTKNSIPAEFLLGVKKRYSDMK